jgi:hypothetical protein
VSGQRGHRQLRISIRFDEEPMITNNLYMAERLFAKWAIQMLLRNASKSESAGPCLHRCTGRALTPQGGGPATTESESESNAHHQRDSII